MAAGDAFDTVMRAVKNAEPIDYAVAPLQQQDRRLIVVFLRDETAQKLIDAVQSALEGRDDWRLSVLVIEATAPKLEEKTDEEKRKTQRSIREEIYDDVARSARLNRDFLIMVALSTVVAAVGLHADSVAAVIGAMVIAPLLGPIMGFSLGAALGDFSLIRKGGLTLLAGVALTLAASVVIALILQVNMESRELLSRAEVRLDGLALALASGAAAALSIARSQSAALVGVMVAAALLPPAAAVGLFAGEAAWEAAGRAGLLLALNVAALVLSALVTLRLKNVRPRTWIERKNAERAIWINTGLSAGFLIVCIGLIIWLDLGSAVRLGH